MKKLFFIYSSNLYELFRDIWESKKSLYVIGMTLAVCFIVCSILSFLVIKEFITIGVFTPHFKNPFFSIEIVFTLLLITELFGLIFMLPKSVASSVGKQFEILSLIFLRDGFKEFSHIRSGFQWESLEEPFINMVIYGFGAMTIFLTIGLTYKLQKHVKITSSEEEQFQFVKLKELLALAMLVAFSIIGYYDIKTLITEGVYMHSFKIFYTVLIFSDIVIVLLALRYTLNYYKIFRYSGFVLATILLRIALSAQVRYDVFIGVVAVLFMFVLTVISNYIIKELPEKIENNV